MTPSKTEQAGEQYRCTKCSCLWRLNPPSKAQPRGSWSLYDAQQKSCSICDNSPEFLSVIERVYGPADRAEDERLKASVDGFLEESTLDLPLNLDHIPANYSEAVEMLRRAKHRLREALENYANLQQLYGAAAIRLQNLGDRVMPLPARAEAAREGFVWVPREPTQAMLDSMADAWRRHNHGDPYDKEMPDIYKAMLAAAPQDEATHD